MATRKRARATTASVTPAVKQRLRGAKAQRRYGFDEVTELRRQAEIAYVQDKDGRSVEWHWQHGPFHKYATFDQFKAWSRLDNWYEQRIEYWRDVQYRVLEGLKAKEVSRIVQAAEKMDDLIDAVEQTLMPVRGKDGKILRDQNDLPVFHLALPPYDRMGKFLLDLLARREAIGDEIVDHILKEKGADSDGVLVVEGQSVETEVHMTPEEARQAARWLLLRRHKQLAATAQGEAHDAMVQAEDGDG